MQINNGKVEDSSPFGFWMGNHLNKRYCCHKKCVTTEKKNSDTVANQQYFTRAL